ncbi:cold shock domain-containing protein [Marinobacterium stanieri]|uniref:Cold shock protein, CspA family n=1 Tax=Marinobacterium stanieri TaxID=49186 RepID=A0A1N6XGI6_9GAMM|nr:cold shock domain-containing protein [Marinobacterium stanieri]SIR01369.1 Cold shock protein, CspA family [Marinobacterium stanieri]
MDKDLQHVESMNRRPCSGVKQASPGTPMTGRVQWFSEDKGFGFLLCEEGTKHYFHAAHVNGFELPLEGDQVMFHSHQRGNKAPLARHLTIVRCSDRQQPSMSRSAPNTPAQSKAYRLTSSNTQPPRRVTKLAHWMLTKLLLAKGR